MNAPAPGELWLIRPAHTDHAVAAIRSREQDAWTVLGSPGQLEVLLEAEGLRPIPGPAVPPEATWDERAILLAGFGRDLVGARQ